ncbi:hypothetical protein CGGC5_v007619 [Colletotrichum fructicola Nara gc5]|uniref:Uncharacterized protein n=1 Tax=Colletotrichum fructicola (strain Nara gc5) TaxID=1213859 RepID=A0A7J6J758_COLFN|nr:hypothetical protein CGGC5_v007619 [Colletotrichum fructicola Nara gc5]
MLPQACILPRSQAIAFRVKFLDSSSRVFDLNLDTYNAKPVIWSSLPTPPRPRCEAHDLEPHQPTLGAD